MPRMPATSGEHAMTSLATSLRNWARELSAPFLWFFHAMRVMHFLELGLVDAVLLRVRRREQAEHGGRGERRRVPSPGGGRVPTRPEKPESFSFSTPMAMATS